jgi:hypothetical protein
MHIMFYKQILLSLSMILTVSTSSSNWIEASDAHNALQANLVEHHFCLHTISCVLIPPFIYTHSFK